MRNSRISRIFGHFHARGPAAPCRGLWGPAVPGGAGRLLWTTPDLWTTAVHCEGGVMTFVPIYGDKSYLPEEGDLWTTCG